MVGPGALRERITEGTHGGRADAREEQEERTLAELIEVVRPAFVERAEQHLDGIADGTLLLLKAHLLLEEALNAAVCAKCANPDYIDRADLNFYKLLQVARALYPVPEDDPKRKKTTEMFWDATEALNTLRNRYAHALEPNKLEPLFQRLYLPNPKAIKSLSEPDVLDALSITSCLLIGYAWGLRSEEG
jgi:hypothetical protein